MPIDARSFPDPPGQCTVRVEPDQDPPVITTMPTREALLEHLRPLGPLGPVMAGAGPSLARGCSCFVLLFEAWGWMFLLFGVGLIGFMAVQTLVFNKPFQFNDKPADKATAVLFLGGFLTFWVVFCSVWIWMVRSLFFPRDKLDLHWRLVLGADNWICYRASLNQRIGHCAPSSIDYLRRSDNGRVVAHLMTGRETPLTGPLPPLDSAWLCDALAARLGSKVENRTAAYPCVPALAAGRIVPGTVLAWRLKQGDGPWRAVLMTAGMNLFWNGIVGVFIGVAFFGEPRINWWLALFLIPFVLVGLILIAVLIGNVWAAIIQSRIGRTSLELGIHPLRVGGHFRAHIFQVGPLSLRELSIKLVCDEVAQYIHGTTTSTASSRVRELTLLTLLDMQIQHGLPLETSFDFDVPADVMHSFEAPHNKIQWKLIVRGVPESCSEYQREFPVIIHPAGPTRELT